MLPPELTTRIYANTPFDVSTIIRLCPNCRQIATAERAKEREQELEGEKNDAITE